MFNKRSTVYYIRIFIRYSKRAEIIKLVAIKVSQIIADQQKNYKEQVGSAREASLKQVNNILSLINSLTGG